jgi:hypothetical protein
VPPYGGISGQRPADRDEQYRVIEDCSPGPYLELFSRGVRKKWAAWGNEANHEYHPSWDTYANHSQAAAE